MDSASRLLTVVLIDPSDDQEKVLGDMALSADNELSLVSAPETSADFLNSLAEQINAQSSLRVKVAGSARYAVGSREYAKSAADFLDGLKRYLQHYYSIDLRSANDFVDHAEDFVPLS